MAQAHSGKKSVVKGSTPGRPKRKDNQFWDIGKVGRKTGITLPDQGKRDEHGLEPVSHIFSSPVSPQRGRDGTLESSGMDIQDSSAPDVDKTLVSRKTPRLPPPRASTPRHTNIGSPKRMSTGRKRQSVGVQEDDGSPVQLRTQPPPNRVLDFGEKDVHKSIESPSPFKPRHVLRRSMGPGHERQNPFASPEKSAKPHVIEEAEDGAEEEDEQAQQGAEEDEQPLMLDEDDYHDAMSQPGDDQLEEEAEEAPVQEEPPKRKPGRPRKSFGDSINTSHIQQQTPPVANMTSGRKRNRSSLEEEANVSHSQISEAGPANKKQRGRRPSKVIVHQDDGDAYIDPALLAHGDEYVAEVSVEPSEPPQKGKGKAKKFKAAAPKERDANRKMVQINDSPSKLRNRSRSRDREGSRSLSVGPISNVHLRAATPYEDAAERTSRYGRNLIQPLKYWANEMRIYKHGETAGIVRADPVEIPKRKVPKKKRGRKAKGGQLEGIEEESETESTHPDEWEEEVGVIAGMVANWDHEKQTGIPTDLIREDLGFAAPSIVTRDVAGSEFKYAKIMTLPFFGSGVVELPPEGYKRAKNSRKMQMCFFVHEGKVMVEVGPGGEGVEVNQFAISKGGVWVVPRGNNYAITNESRTKTARIFFAQGCEVDALAQ